MLIPKEVVSSLPPTYTLDTTLHPITFCATVSFLPNIENKLKDVQLTSISEVHIA